MTALVRNPAHGSDPVLKYDSPLITLKMLSCGTTNGRERHRARDADRDQQRPPDVGEQRREERRQAEEHRARRRRCRRRARARRRSLNCWPIDGARIGIASGGTIAIAKQLRESGSGPRAEQLFACHRQRQREQAPSPSTIHAAVRRIRAGSRRTRPSSSGCRETSDTR